MHKNNNTIKMLALTIKASSAVSRIRILYALKFKKMCVCELAFVIGISQPSVSRHLRKLIKAGFIGFEQSGLWTDYYLEPKNKYAGNFLDNLNIWLQSDVTICGDKKKLKHVNRKKLCKQQGCS